MNRRPEQLWDLGGLSGRIAERGELLRLEAVRRQSSAELFIKAAGSQPLLKFQSGQTIYRQQEPAEAMFYVLKGGVRLTATSKAGKEAVLAILRDGHYFGEASLIGGSKTRLSTATALCGSIVACFTRQEMARRIREDGEFAAAFVAYLAEHRSRAEAALIDQFLNCTEKRLARVLLSLADVGLEHGQSVLIPRVSQETLAKMIGSSRARVSTAMNKFRRKGFIEYNGELKVNHSLTLVLDR